MLTFQNIKIETRSITFFNSPSILCNLGTKNYVVSPMFEYYNSLIVISL